MIFFCCSERAGLRLVSLATGSCIKYDPSQREEEGRRGEGSEGEGRESVRQPPLERRQVAMDGNSLGVNQMYGRGGVDEL